MQPNPKPSQTGQTPAVPPATTPVADVSIADASTPGAAHVSPARALQARLAAELSQRSRPWFWHSAGLVLTLILSLWIAGLMLNAGV